MMKKKFLIMCFVGCFLFGISGCGDAENSIAETHKAYTFEVETGDNIRVELDTTGGYDMSADVPFEITENDEILSEGTFIEAEAYNQYVAAVNSDANATVLDSGSKDSNEYIFWSYNDSEFDVAMLIGDSNTGILLGNTVSEDSARECLERLTVYLDE